MNRAFAALCCLLALAASALPASRQADEESRVVGVWRFDVDSFPSPWGGGKTVGDELKHSRHTAKEVKDMNTRLASLRAARIALHIDHTYSTTWGKHVRTGTWTLHGEDLTLVAKQLDRTLYLKDKAGHLSYSYSQLPPGLGLSGSGKAMNLVRVDQHGGN